MTFQYRTHGTCSQLIQITIEDDIIQNVEFLGGCMGNLLGISSLVRGMKVDDVIARLADIPCGSKGTSCHDQLAHALAMYRREHPHA